MKKFYEYVELKSLNNQILETADLYPDNDELLVCIENYLKNNEQSIYNEFWNDFKNWASNTRVGQTLGQAFKAGSSSWKNPVWPRYTQSIRSLEGLADILHRNGKNINTIKKILTVLRAKEPELQQMDNEIRYKAAQHNNMYPNQQQPNVNPNQQQPNVNPNQQQPTP